MGFFHCQFKSNLPEHDIFALCDRAWYTHVDTIRIMTFFAPQGTCMTAQQTQNICLTFIQRRPNVFDVGPTLYKCYTNVLCLL